MATAQPCPVAATGPGPCWDSSPEMGWDGAGITVAPGSAGPRGVVCQGRGQNAALKMVSPSEVSHSSLQDWNPCPPSQGSQTSGGGGEGLCSEPWHVSFVLIDTCGPHTTALLSMQATKEHNSGFIASTARPASLSPCWTVVVCSPLPVGGFTHN